MKRNLCWIPAVVLGLLGCASTQLKSHWKDPAFSVGSMHKALVMAVVPQTTSQRVMEDAFVKNLSEHGVQAVPSYTLSPVEAKLEEAGWKRLITDNHFDTVLVARLVDVKTVEREVPPTTTVMNTGGANPVNAPIYGSNNWYGYYQNSYQVVSTPGYTIKDQIAVAETKLYDIGNEKLVWTGSTHTQVYPEQNTGALLRQFSKIIVDAIYK